ncbi:MAG: hypothetical protein HYV93_19915 [Candidatus Rokubacteria bacterium]|nr:hypothetical protein [Candidatus Rokubacteria bacterium]
MHAIPVVRRLLATGVACLGVATASAESLSPAQQKIAAAERVIQAAPERAEAHADLALALARRARETADPTYYDRADAAIARSLEVAPGNLAAERTRIWVRLGKHEFAQALELAQRLNRKVPDDLMTYGFLVDANVELGNYAEAEEAAQWLLNLRPGNIAGLTRAAYLRELFGDIEGALDLMQMAYGRTPPTEVEEQAWILTQMAHLQLMQGKVDVADSLLGQALARFPDYHYALGQLARVRSAQGRHREAVGLERRRYERAPYPEHLFALGMALRQGGERQAAARAFAEFERKARAEMDGWDNANRELVFYYADVARRPGDALTVAEKEIARRRDVHTRDAYAWALSLNGRHAEARREIEQALAVGIREAGMLYRAGAIAAKLKDREAARRYLDQSLALAPRWATSDAARRLLARLGGSGVTSRPRDPGAPSPPRRR